MIRLALIAMGFYLLPSGLAHCSAHGDPHYSSFDGKRYDFQGACKYYLLKYCGEDDEVSFDIIQENEPPSNNAHVTITKEITIRIFGMVS